MDLIFLILMNLETGQVKLLDCDHVLNIWLEPRNIELHSFNCYMLLILSCGSLICIPCWLTTLGELFDHVSFPYKVVCVYMHGCSVVSDFLWPQGLLTTRLLCWWDFPGKNSGVSCHLLHQWLFLIQGSNPHLLHLLHWQVDSLSPGKLYTAEPPLNVMLEGAEIL